MCEFLELPYNEKPKIVQKRYLIVSGVHGNEPAPVFAIKDFIMYLSRTQIVRNDLCIDFYYIVNPWGFEYNIRYNANGADINRDLITLRTQESKLITNNFNINSYEMVFDFHEASSQNIFMYCYGIQNINFSKNIIQLLITNNVNLDTGYKDVILTSKNGILYVPFYAALYMSIKKTLTVGLYYTRSTNAFTFETPKSGNIVERKRTIRLILDYILIH